MAGAFVKFQFTRDTQLLVGIVQLFCTFGAKPDDVLRAAKQPDGGIGAQFGKVLFAVDLGGFVHHIKIERHAHIRVRVGARNKCVAYLGGIVDPLRLALIPLKLKQVVRKPVDKLGAPIPCHQKEGESEYLAYRAKRAHVSGAEDGDSGDVRPLLGKRLAQKAAVGVPRQKDGKSGVLLLQPLAEEQFVLQRIAEDVAFVPAALLIRLRPAVCAVVVRKNDVPAGIQIPRKSVVIPAVLAHSVKDLHHALGRFHVVPKGSQCFR